MRPAIVAAAVALLITTGVWADGIEISIDPDRSTVSFVLGATMHKVRGTFRIDDGKIGYDPATGTATGEVVVDAQSGNSGNEKRDRDMHRKVLKSAGHPTIVLRPEHIAGELPAAGDGRLKLTGELSIHGVDHEVEIPLEVSVDGSTVSVSAEFDVPYVEWVLEDPSKLFLRVAKHVTVSVEAVGVLAGRDF